VKHRLACWSALALAAALLAGCTGTKEPRPPTLLIVGYEAAGGVPTLALVEDAGPAEAGLQRLEFVAGSERSLEGAAVGLDFEDREGSRGAAWVLTRSQSTVGGEVQVSAYLQRFTTQAVNPAAPTGFAEDTGARVTLTGPGGALVDPGLPGRTACPSTVQVSRTGRWAVILDDPTACGLSDVPVQWLLDTQALTAGALRATADVLAASPYTDQASVNERAYFLVNAIQRAQVYSTDFATPAAWYKGMELESGDSPMLDMAGSGTLLVGLSEKTLTSVDTSDPAAKTTPATLKQAAGAGSRLVMDPFGAATEVFVLGANRVAMHRSPSAAEVGSIPNYAAAATIDPANRFAYLLTNGAVEIVDLLSGQDLYDLPFRWEAFTVSELTLPVGPLGRPLGVIDWVRAAEPPLLGPVMAGLRSSLSGNLFRQ